MQKKDRMLTIADLLFTLLCLIAIACWYMQIPYKIEVTAALGLLAIGVLFFMKKGWKAESEFIDSYSELLENENYFRTAFDYAASGMALLSTHGQYLKVNHSLCQLLGYHEDELLKLSMRRVMQKEDFLSGLNSLREIIGVNSTNKSIQNIARYYTKDGDVIWIATNISFVRDKDNKPLYFVAQFQNANAKNILEKRIHTVLYTDLLTGLPNRSFLDKHLNELLFDVKKTKKEFAILLLDLDCLKKINDSISHEAGDTLLKTVVERLKSTVREEDMIARIGGDEFVIVINRVNQPEIIAQIAQKILHQLLKAITIEKHEIYITGSIGISLYPNDGQDIETLLKNADAALYKAKQKHGNHYEFCLPDLTEKAQEKSKQKSALSSALAKQELQLYYQPCVDATNKTINSVEALIRWQSDQYGLVMPDTIISMAEETGLIIPVSEWVLRTACKQVKKWQETINPSLKLSINISVYQFKSSSFMKNIIRALRESEFSPTHFVIEITEGLIMHNYDHTMKMLNDLKSEGVTIVVDDFGTGLSSFSYLANNSVDKIKIDKVFIDKILLDKSQTAMVGAMISMAKKLGIQTVAEGVETQQQYDYLVSEGCDEIQGYLIAKPMPIELMESFLAARIVTSVAQTK